MTANSSPPVAAGYIILSAHLGYQLPQPAQYTIPFEMSERIVEQLEVVDVHHHQGKGLIQLFCTANLQLKPSPKIPHIEQTGQTICKSQKHMPPLGNP
jgi:hypothetical protein